jgi:hypothetical protein
MSKPTVVPSVPSAKVLARFQHYFETFPKVTSKEVDEHSMEVSRCTHNLMGDLKLNPEAKAMLLESARIHDENEDRAYQLSIKALDELSPHARAALDRLIGKAHDPE